MYRFKDMRDRFSAFIMIFTTCILVFCCLSSLSHAKEYEISNYDIEMQVNEEGDFLVEERITFHFIEGDFTYAYREIERNVFSNLEFAGIEGLDVPVEDYELSGRRNLRIKWYYDHQERRKAIFLLRYIGRAGLQSVSGENLIHWTPTGSDWDVPIRDLDVRISLPWPVGVTELRPAGDLLGGSEREYHFHKAYLAPGEEYRLYLAFPEQVEMTARKADRGWEWKREDILYFVLLLIAGFVWMLVDIVGREKPLPRRGQLTVRDLLMYEKALLLNYYDTRRGITVQIYELARKGKIKLISSLKKNFFWGKQAEITAEILNRDNLSSVEKKILDRLEKDNRLNELFQDYRWFSRMDRELKDSLQERGFISEKARHNRKRTLYSSLLFVLVGVAFLVLGGVYRQALLLGLGVAAVTMSFGRMLKGLLYNIFTQEALFLKEEVEAEINEKKKRLESLIKTKDYNAALEYFFQEIEYIILHKDFNAVILDRYKRTFKKADEVEAPAWIEIDTAELGTTLAALELVEMIDYVLLSTMVVGTTGTYTGTSTGGMGGGGGGVAGGGGGGAG